MARRTKKKQNNTVMFLFVVFIIVLAAASVSYVNTVGYTYTAFPGQTTETGEITPSDYHVIATATAYGIGTMSGTKKCSASIVCDNGATASIECEDSTYTPHCSCSCARSGRDEIYATCECM